MRSPASSGDPEPPLPSDPSVWSRAQVAKVRAGWPVGPGTDGVSSTGVTTGEIARLTGPAAGSASGSASGMVDRLENAGFVERRPDPNGRRRALVALAPGAAARPSAQRRNGAVPLAATPPAGDVGRHGRAG
ncbi:MarR family transcriptional regulator [Streptomyces sp. NPDC001848]|uniref:MarR family transcriptional regulator n=1 Tax=Streptomyces sp. NPDC001848 TaxID=3364618 RepID=UPI0036A4B538